MIPLLTLAACAATTASEPSLGRRPAELIDPRLPVPAASASGPVNPALASKLGQLIADGADGARAFDALVAEAETHANAAGPAHSENWIVAQQSLSALEGARAKTTTALAEVDAIASARIASGAGLTPSDLAAVEAASNAIRATTDRQDEIISRLAARLGS